MKKSSKVLLALGAGAIAGGIAGYYLNSDKGRKSRKNAVKNVRETAKQAGDKINEMAITARAAIGDVAGQAKTYINGLVNTTDKVLDAAVENLENGKDTLKAKVKSVASNSLEKV